MRCRVQSPATIVVQRLLAFRAQRGFRSSLVTPWAVVLLLAAAGLCQSQAPSRSSSIQPDPIVVTVSAEAIPLSASSASVTILTREFVENSRAQSMADLLRQVPFLYMSQTGGTGWIDNDIPEGRGIQFHPGHDRRGSGERHHQPPRGRG